jgi:hypothetical protein
MINLDGDTVAAATRERPLANIRGQVARILLEYADNGRSGQNRLAQRDIAEMLNTGWDQVHSLLESFKNEGAIKIEGNRIIIGKRLLQEAADGG